MMTNQVAQLFHAVLRIRTFAAILMNMIKAKAFAKNLIHLIFPSTKTEIILFFIFLIGYGILATEIASNYRIIFDNRIPWDAYFSFDNRSIVFTGGGFERHPLANYFFDQLRNFSLWISNGKYNADFRLTLAYCSVLAVSLALIQIFKYLKNSIQLPLYVSISLVVFTAFFSTSILLSFTPETYTYTFLLLAIFNYYSALKIRSDKKISGVGLGLFAVATGGLTITNIVKIYIPVLFEKDIFRNWKKFGNAVARVGISVIVFVLLYLNRLEWDFTRIFSKTTEQYDKFSQPKVVPIWDMILSWFFGGNVLFSSFMIRDYHNKKGFDYKALFMDVYDGIGQYAFVIVLLILILWSVIKNRKNRLVWILAISFLVDIIIHCVLKFGLHTSYIYGGHFVFVYPLLLGWLLYSYRHSKVFFSVVFGLFLMLFAYLVGNNIYRMSEFFEFINRYYQ